MRTLRSRATEVRATEMSGNRRQPSRRGQVGQGPAWPSELAWSLPDSCARQALLQEVVSFWQCQAGIAPSSFSLDSSGTLASSSLTSCLSHLFHRPGKRRR